MLGEKLLLEMMISPASDSVNESLSCLRYANSAKNIENKPRVNRDRDANLILQLRQEIKRLQSELVTARGYGSSLTDMSMMSSLAQHSLAESTTLKNTEEEEREREMLEERMNEAQSIVKQLKEENQKLKETLDEERKKRYQAESQLEYRMTKGMKENEKMFITNEVMTPDDLQSVDISLYHVSLVL